MQLRLDERHVSTETAAHSKLDKKAQYGQFFTPPSIAEFMASFFASDERDICRLLDAGAGVGALSTAFLNRWIDDRLDFTKLELDVFEIDRSLLPQLQRELLQYQEISGFSFTLRNRDFILAAADCLSGSFFAEPLPRYTHAILNPPYKKIRSDSAHRSALRRAGIETVNLYSAFVALAVSLLDDHGQLVAIIPRSFCNGPYYRPFREHILAHSALRRIHLFASRDKAFKDDDVLQENIILKLEKGGKQAEVLVSTSTDDTFVDLVEFNAPFHRIVIPGDSEQFIHIPTSQDLSTLELHTSVRYSLDDLEINVSTGPVVDFRVRKHLRSMPDEGTVPLLYPGHFNGMQMEWPRPGFNKPNAVELNRETQKWLYPTGAYCVVRRFSSKEETRRIVASVVDPEAVGNFSWLGFENHLNVFHEDKHGLGIELAHGLAVYLNTTAFDEYFRRFSGHTQVNVTDLKLVKYPDRKCLIALGRWAIEQPEITQAMIDDIFEHMVK